MLSYSISQLQEDVKSLEDEKMKIDGQEKRS